MIRLIIFASGSGTNAENIIKFFKDSRNIKVTFVLTNSKNAKVLERSERLEIPSKIFSKSEFNSKEFLQFLKNEADFIILAGFLLKVPEEIIKSFPNKIVNIHPALLPKYGGKGMYGMHVHKAVVDNNEKFTGITIHYVNENYDEGAIIFQREVALNESDTPDDVAAKIHKLEQDYFPQVIEKTVLK
ncbi:MAG: phosphoribosylglycinamide formyltransferase [Flavobacteriaceae bacterium]|nr:phosphoribosylglycinamide formyltransferase [Flavobacteriaceae bacterium]